MKKSSKISLNLGGLKLGASAEPKTESSGFGSFGKIEAAKPKDKPVVQVKT
jgi:hypothetical protein